MSKPSGQARAFWIAEPGRGEIRTEALRAPAAGEALVRTLFTGVSRGTEALVFNGKVPRSEHTRMRAPFQAGDFPAPVKYGYCNVGVVEQGPAALVGRRVFCLYPHQDRYVVPVGALHALPDELPPARAVLAREFGNRRQRAVGCGAARRRSRRRDRRRHRRLSRGLARRANRRRRGRAHRRRRAQGHRRARSRRAVPHAGGGARATSTSPCTRAAARRVSQPRSSSPASRRRSSS